MIAHCCTIGPLGEVCLGCGEPWPCRAAERVTVMTLEPPAPPGPEDVLAAALMAGVPWWVAADQLGVDRDAVSVYLEIAKGGEIR